MARPHPARSFTQPGAARLGLLAARVVIKDDDHASNRHPKYELDYAVIRRVHLALFLGRAELELCDRSHDRGEKFSELARLLREIRRRVLSFNNRVILIAVYLTI